MNRKFVLKSFSVFIIIMICLLVLVIFSVFNGPPFGGALAKSKILNYTSVMYENVQVVTSVSYNLKDGCYNAELLDKNEQRITNIKYRIFKNKLIDYLGSKKISEQFDTDFSKAIQSFPNTIEIPQGHIFTEIYATDRYTKKIDDLNLSQKLYILGIKNFNLSISIDESMKKPAEITRKIIDELGKKYCITDVQIIYIDVNGVFEISDIDSKKLYKDLVEKTHKLEQIGENEKKFMESLRLKRK